MGTWQVAASSPPKVALARVSGRWKQKSGETLVESDTNIIYIIYTQSVPVGVKPCLITTTEFNHDIKDCRLKSVFFSPLWIWQFPIWNQGSIVI